MKRNNVRYRVQEIDSATGEIIAETAFTAEAAARSFVSSYDCGGCTVTLARVTYGNGTVKVEAL